MKDRSNFPPRPSDMSQLDYLWLNFGGKQVASELSDNPSDDRLLSEKAISALIKKIEGSGLGIAELRYDEDPLDPTMMRLTGMLPTGDPLTMVRIPKEVHVAGFAGRRATQEDIDNGFKFPINSQVLAITMTNGDEYLVSLEELNLVVTGGETDTVFNSVTNGIIKSNLKIDSGNNELSVVKLKYSDKGLYTHLAVKNDNTGIVLENDGGALKASMPIGTTGYNLKVDNLTLAEYMNIPFKDPGTLYFITDVPYQFLGTRRYGMNIEPGDAPIVSLVYDPDTLTLAYKRSDESDIRLVKLGPVSEIQNGMMTKYQYADLLKLKIALDDIISVKDYVSEQVGTAGFKLEWGEVKARTKELLLKNKFGDKISSVEVDKENFLDFAESRKATSEDVIQAAKSGLLIEEGEQIFIFTLTSGDKVYASVKELVDTYTGKNTKTINLQISPTNQISADVNISDNDKMLFAYNDGLASHLQIVREPGKVTFYGKTLSQEDKLGEFNLADPRIKTIFVASLTEEIAAEYKPRLVDGKEYDRLTNPVKLGEPYLIECFGSETQDPSKDFRYNDYISVLQMVNSFTLSPKEGNILSRDENGYLYASLKLIDV